jgi:hypothetical protein
MYEPGSILRPLRREVLRILHGWGMPPEADMQVTDAFAAFEEDRVIVDLDVHFRVVGGKVEPVWEADYGEEQPGQLRREPPVG